MRYSHDLHYYELYEKTSYSVYVGVIWRITIQYDLKNYTQLFAVLGT